jgi:predicted nucleotidyltransferase
MSVKDYDFNMLQLDAVAAAMGELNGEITYVGGAATALLVPEVAISGSRRTEDVDVLIDVLSLTEYYRFCESLRKKGFVEDTGVNAVICRWLAPTALGQVQVDVMPTDPVILGFSNRWYKKAIELADEVTLPSGIQIRVVSAPYFLATKLEAFKGRGNGDYFSHDLEDLIFVVENRDRLVVELMSCEMELRYYLAAEMKALLNDDFLNVLPGLLVNRDGANGVEQTLRLVSKW